MTNKWRKMKMVVRPLTWHRGDGIFWFRIFGRGIVIEDRTKKRALFSERYGYTKWLRLGKWAIKKLRPKYYHPFSRRIEEESSVASDDSAE